MVVDHDKNILRKKTEPKQNRILIFIVILRFEYHWPFTYQQKNKLTIIPPTKRNLMT